VATTLSETAIIRGPSFTDADGQVVLTLDASYSQQHEYSAEATDHPVEDGINITDHVRKNPITLKINGVVSAFQLDNPDANSGRERDAWALLEGMVGQVFEVSTSMRRYPSMVLLRASASRDAGQGDDLLPSLELREIRKVKQQTVTLPPEIIKKKPQKASGPGKQDLGRQPTDAASEAQRRAANRSVAAALLDLAGAGA
jgi:hypothetical protein